MPTLCLGYICSQCKSVSHKKTHSSVGGTPEMRSGSTKPCVYETLSSSSPSSVSYFILLVESMYVHLPVNYSVESKIEEAVLNAVSSPFDSVSESSQCPKGERRPRGFL